MCTFCRGVACEYFGAHGTRSRVVHVVEFWGGPKFEVSAEEELKQLCRGMPPHGIFYILFAIIAVSV